MNPRIVKVRKDHKCDTCQLPVIKKGDYAEYYEHKFGRYDDRDNQIGIEFYKAYMCQKCQDELKTDIESAVTSIMFENMYEAASYYSPTHRQTGL